MSLTSAIAPNPVSNATRRERVLYWVPTGLLCVVFSVSAALTFLDPEATRVSTAKLGFPTFLIYPLAISKVLGVVAILSSWSRTLVAFAFAGFLFDMLLALSAHVHESDFPAGWLAVFGLVVWVAAFVADRHRFGGRAE